MLKTLIKIANKLDSIGLTKEADIIDQIIIKASEDPSQRFNLDNKFNAGQKRPSLEMKDLTGFENFDTNKIPYDEDSLKKRIEEKIEEEIEENLNPINIPDDLDRQRIKESMEIFAKDFIEHTPRLIGYLQSLRSRSKGKYNNIDIEDILSDTSLHLIKHIIKKKGRTDEIPGFGLMMLSAKQRMFAFVNSPQRRDIPTNPEGSRNYIGRSRTNFGDPGSPGYLRDINPDDYPEIYPPRTSPIDTTMLGEAISRIKEKETPVDSGALTMSGEEYNYAEIAAKLLINDEKYQKMSDEEKRESVRTLANTLDRRLSRKQEKLRSWRDKESEPIPNEWRNRYYK